MMETISLKGEQTFLKIAEGDAIYYGGDQAWYDFTVGIHSGCGTVAAADITAYLAGQIPALRGLYGAPGAVQGVAPGDAPVSMQGRSGASEQLPGMTKADFLAHMNEMYRWVKPWKVPFVSRNRPPWKNFGWGLGVWPPFCFARGVKRYARSRGICLKDRRISSRRSMEELTGFIRESLERDCPVAMLIGRKPRYERELVERPDGFKWMQTHFSMHWVVITMLTNQSETVMVKVSTWGGYSWLDLDAWHRAGSRMSGLVSFAWTDDM